jgi:hypothetical protein
MVVVAGRNAAKAVIGHRGCIAAIGHKQTSAKALSSH